MGAGAGYKIFVEDVEVSNFKSISIASIDKEQNVFNFDCEADAVGSVRGESYYDGCPFIKDVKMILTGISVGAELFDSNGYHVDPDMLTPEGAKRLFAIMVQDYDIDDISECPFDNDFIQALEISDLNPDYFKSFFSSSYFNITGESDTIGAGWSHATFDGNFTIETDSYDTYDLNIPDKFIVDYLDRAIVGDNKVYDIIYNGEIHETMDDEDDAIAELKTLISEGIKIGGIESVNLDECYVEQGYEFLLNGEGDSDVDFDTGYRYYEAIDDPDYSDYTE